VLYVVAVDDIDQQDKHLAIALRRGLGDLSLEEHKAALRLIRGDHVTVAFSGNAHLHPGLDFLRLLLRQMELMSPIGLIEVMAVDRAPAEEVILVDQHYSSVGDDGVTCGGLPVRRFRHRDDEPEDRHYGQRR
jgi:hypothetical protein